MFARRGTGMVHQVVEGDPSVGGRLAWLAARLTIRPTLALGSYVANVPWPWGLIDVAAGALTPAPGCIRATIRLPRCSARLVRAAGVLPADGTRRVVLYMHGGAFVTCGANTHDRLVTTLSNYADSPVLVVNYRLLPKHSIGAAIDDCYDAYRWLRGRGYRPQQIVLAGDSAGGYLSLALAQRLLGEGEKPAAIVAMSPLMQLAKSPKQAHPNMRSDALFCAKAFDAFTDWITRAAQRTIPAEEIYEPLDHIRPGLPPTVIHVSGCEVLLHDARLAARRLTAVGVPVQLRVWPGQMHVFQIAASMVPEANRSLRQIGDYVRAATDRHDVHVGGYHRSNLSSASHRPVTKRHNEIHADAVAGRGRCVAVGSC
ncbi:esterase [Mycobacterium noviomagense]|uniref:Esterase n=1 Tax=Mycobacterium noviomagense TaxID=459858 RepID=A0A7I7PHE9_9MYCO|nr:alpha/beta hydrolase [Mycobacterium noviomagense]BBY07981.1 esterase [Mycobacterium noviomagense]